MDIETLKLDLVSKKEGEYFFTHTAIKRELEPHRHDYIEFFIVEKGNATHVIENNNNKINKNNICLVLPEEIHTFTDQSDDFVHRDLCFSHDFFLSICDTYNINFLDKFKNKEIILSIALLDNDITEIEQLCDFLDKQDGEERIFWSKVLLNKLVNFFLINSIKNNDVQPTWISSMITAFNNIDLYNYSFKNIINTFDFSHEYMSRTFKKYTGYKLIEYFNKKRMEIAYKELKSKNLTIPEISKMLGINNLSHFYELFKKEYGTTPLKIRKK